MLSIAKSLSICLLILLSCVLNLKAQEEANDFSKDELLGKIDPASHIAFDLVPIEYCSRGGIYLRVEVLDAFMKLRDAAADEDLELVVISGARSFTHQKSIWERKWGRTRYMGWSEFDKASDIITYSSMPGTSRHHWGTDVDLNSLDNSYFKNGEGLKVYDFLDRCAGEFGFVQVYTSKSRGRTGYEEEKWHWSYMPIAKLILNKYNNLVNTGDINGFDGSAAADSLQIITDFVNGISK